MRRLRPGDVFARWGGEEFVLLLPWIGADGATCAAERLRAGIAEMRLQSPRARFAVTLSIGIAIARAGEALDDLGQLVEHGARERVDRAAGTVQRQHHDAVGITGGLPMLETQAFEHDRLRERTGGRL